MATVAFSSAEFELLELGEDLAGLALLELDEFFADLELLELEEDFADFFSLGLGHFKRKPFMDFCTLIFPFFCFSALELFFATLVPLRPSVLTSFASTLSEALLFITTASMIGLAASCTP